MPYRKIEIRAGHYYHLYNRGANRQNIFFDRGNWAFFIERLRAYFLPGYVDILVYCLMPNHYHLLVYIKTDDFSKLVMQPFTLSYVKAINKQQQRSGPLFEGPFQAIHIDKDKYLRHLSRYIHMNPVVANLAQAPEEWQFSSYRDYVELRQGTLPNKKMILSQFPSIQAYQQFVRTYNSSDDKLIQKIIFRE